MDCWREAGRRQRERKESRESASDLVAWRRRAVALEAAASRGRGWAPSVWERTSTSSSWERLPELSLSKKAKAARSSISE
ncbi:hypothetical protein AB1Y20_016810 [Prymnesium parvum]|uniref:Uncharacterized protein n=1 Tax=Prymnesium parvum TaxID=97485 RepID=A0AB34IA11_PRYPA